MMEGGAVTGFTPRLHVWAGVAVLGHAAMALFHHYVLKDGLLLKMMRAR